MSDHIYKIVELVGSSPTSIEDAIQSAIARASTTVGNYGDRITVNYGDSLLNSNYGGNYGDKLR